MYEKKMSKYIVSFLIPVLSKRMATSTGYSCSIHWYSQHFFNAAQIDRRRIGLHKATNLSHFENTKVIHDLMLISILSYSFAAILGIDHNGFLLLNRYAVLTFPFSLMQYNEHNMSSYHSNHIIIILIR